MNDAIRSMFGGSTKSAMATILSFSMEDKAVLCAIETSRRYVDSAASDPSAEMAVVISNAQEEERFLKVIESESENEMLRDLAAARRRDLHATNGILGRQTQSSDCTQANASKLQIKEMANTAGAILKEYLAIHNGAFKGKIFADRHIDLRETESVKLHLTHLRQKIEDFSKGAKSIPEDQAIYLEVLLNYVCALQETTGILEQAQIVMSSTRVPGLKEAKTMHEEYEHSIQNYQTIGKELIARARTVYS